MSGKTELGISYTPTAKLNAGTGDATSGGSVNQGTGADLYGGQAGIEIQFQEGAVYYDETVGTLYRGIYKRVQTLSTGGDGVLGQIAFWSDPNTALVTAIPEDGNQAGVFINTTVDAGNWCWIQVGGLASVLMSDSQSQGTPAVKDVVVCVSGDVTADALADGTSFTAGVRKRELGIAEGTPIAGDLCLVELYDRFSSPDK